MHIGRKIAELRQKAQMSQEQLAERVGISRAFLAQVETGKSNVKTQLIERLSQALHIPKGTFFGEDNPEMTEFADKAKRFDELVALIKNTGLIEGGMNKNVYVNGHSNNVVVNAEQQKIIEKLIDKDAEEKKMIMKMLDLNKEEKEDLLRLYAAFKDGLPSNIKSSKKTSYSGIDDSDQTEDSNDTDNSAKEGANS
jgi:transcriptional regulator with XRE-family HTH domain